MSAKRNKHKKTSETNARDPESKNTLEKFIKNKVNKQKVKNHVDKIANKIVPLSVLTYGKDGDVKNDMKKNQLEKRKNEGSEWKPLKKTEYQRLETVEEEGQLSSEENSPKDNSLVELNRSECESDNEQVSLDFFLLNKPKKHRLYNLVSISEQPESWISGDEPEKLIQESSERTDFVEIEENHAEPVTSLSKESLDKVVSSKRIGMMEILPIFSNTKFVCSRDTISIEECEDTDSIVNGGKREGPLVLDFEERFENCHKSTEKVGYPKKLSERKLRYKLLTETCFPEKTSSPFINSLLVLTPFAVERENSFKEKKSNEVNIRCNEVNVENSFPTQEVQDEVSWKLKIIAAIICTILGLFSVVIAIAWNFYQPPRLADYIFKFVPFVQRRQMLVTRSATVSVEIDNVYNCFSYFIYNNICVPFKNTVLEYPLVSP